MVWLDRRTPYGAFGTKQDTLSSYLKKQKPSFVPVLTCLEKKPNIEYRNT